MYNIKQASGGAIQETVELRFEETCDRFGLGVCLGFGTQDDLQEEFKGAATDGIRVTDRDRVERLKRLEPLSELPDQEDNLGEQIEPYHDQLKRILELQIGKGDPGMFGDQDTLQRFFR